MPGAVFARGYTMACVRCANGVGRARAAVRASAPCELEVWAWPASYSKKDVGRRGWRWLHLVSISYPCRAGPHEARAMHCRIWHFVLGLSCGECRAHAAAYLQARPPALAGSAALQVWAWTFHNEVNARTGAKPFSLADYNAAFAAELAGRRCTCAGES